MLSDNLNRLKEELYQERNGEYERDINNIFVTLNCSNSDLIQDILDLNYPFSQEIIDILRNFREIGMCSIVNKTYEVYNAIDLKIKIDKLFDWDETRE